MARRRTIKQIDSELEKVAARRFGLLDYLTRNLDRELRECDDEIDRLLDERATLTGGLDVNHSPG